MPDQTLTDTDIARLGPGARAQVERHRPRPAPAPASRPSRPDPKPAQPSRPQSTPAPTAATAARRSTRRVKSSFKIPKILTAKPRRTLVAEFVAGLILITGGDVGSGTLPNPSDYMAWTIVFLVLALLQEMGLEQPTAAFGLLMLGVLVMSHAGGLVKVLDYLGGKTNAPAAGPPPPVSPPVQGQTSMKQHFLGGAR